MLTNNEAGKNDVQMTGTGNGMLALKLSGVIAGVLAFVFFVMVPLYTLLCTKGGSQPNPNSTAVVATEQESTGRFVDVYFESKVFDDLPVRFYADQARQRAEVGTDVRNTYRFQNLSDHPVRFRPIHQVSPNQAAAVFGMKVCFCFNDQEIEAGGEEEFPVVYRFAPEMDERVVDVTIRYSLLALVEGESEEASKVRAGAVTEGDGVIVTPRFKDSDAGRGAP